MTTFRPEEAWGRLATFSSRDVFHADEVADLPSPARRYLLHAIEPGTALAARVHLRMHGHMCLKPGGRRLPMEAEQVIASPHGFVWKAAVGPWWARVVGHDAYEGGHGQMRWRLWGVVPIVDASGPDVSRSAAGRLAIESILLPSALLPSRGASWSALDDSTARVTLTLGDRAHALDLTVAPSGRLVEARMMRWGDPAPQAEYRLEPFGTSLIEQERTVAGYTIPTKLSVAWRPGSDDAFEFFSAEFDDVAFG